MVDRQKWQEAKDKRLEALRLAGTGMPLAQVLAEVGWAVPTYRYHRQKYKGWAADLDAARALGARDRAYAGGGRSGRVKLTPGDGIGQAGQLSHAQWTARYLTDPNVETLELASGIRGVDGDDAQGPYLQPLHPHHVRFCQALDDTEHGDITMVTTFPEAGKSTALLAWCARKLCEEPDHRIAYVSESQMLTRKFCGRLRGWFENAADLPLLHEAYGPFYEPGQEKQNKPWTADFFRVWKASGSEADYSFQSLAWSSAAYGSRIDTLILDDVQSRRTLSQSETILEHLQQTFFTRGRAMRIVMIGNRLGSKDIYEAMLDAEIVDHHVVIPAVDYQGKPTCPEWFSFGGRGPEENLERIRRRVGDRVWYAGYQQQPLADALSTFGEFLDRCLDRDRRWGELEPGRAA